MLQASAAYKPFEISTLADAYAKVRIRWASQCTLDVEKREADRHWSHWRQVHILNKPEKVGSKTRYTCEYSEQAIIV